MVKRKWMKNYRDELKKRENAFLPSAFSMWKIKLI
jgi:hypothetical protein